MNPLVIDISHWQEEPDWNTLGSEGTIGVILKATQGTGYVDPTYGPRANAARDAGMLVASYHFLEAGDVIEQMQWYLERVCPDIGDRLVIDFEENPDGDNPSFEDLETAAEYLLSSGAYHVAVYGSGHLMYMCEGRKSEVLSRTSLWQARYSDDEPEVPTNIWARWDMWQYTDEGQPEGCIGDTDCNRWNLDSGSLYEWFHKGMDALIEEPEAKTIRIDITMPVDAQVEIYVNGLKIGSVQTMDAD